MYQACKQRQSIQQQANPSYQHPIFPRHGQSEDQGIGDPILPNQGNAREFLYQTSSGVFIYQVHIISRRRNTMRLRPRVSQHPSPSMARKLCIPKKDHDIDSITGTPDYFRVVLIY